MAYMFCVSSSTYLISHHLCVCVCHVTAVIWAYVCMTMSHHALPPHSQDFTANKPIHVLEMKLVNARPDTSGSYRFILTTSKKSYV